MQRVYPVTIEPAPGKPFPPTQGGRKHTTHIVGLAPYRLAPERVAREAARAFAAAGSTGPCATDPTVTEAVIQVGRAYAPRPPAPPPPLPRRRAPRACPAGRVGPAGRRPPRRPAASGIRPPAKSTGLGRRGWRKRAHGAVIAHAATRLGETRSNLNYGTIFKSAKARRRRQ